jgi:hypothetical protein
MIIVSAAASLDAVLVLVTMYTEWPVYVFMIGKTKADYWQHKKTFFK